MEPPAALLSALSPRGFGTPTPSSPILAHHGKWCHRFGKMLALSIKKHIKYNSTPWAGLLLGTTPPRYTREVNTCPHGHLHTNSHSGSDAHHKQPVRVSRRDASANGGSSVKQRCSATERNEPTVTAKSTDRVILSTRGSRTCSVEQSVASYGERPAGRSRRELSGQLACLCLVWVVAAQVHTVLQTPN